MTEFDPDNSADPIDGRLLDLDYRIVCQVPELAAVLRSVLADSLGPIGATPTTFVVRSAEHGLALDVGGHTVAEGADSWVFSNLLYQLNRHTVASVPESVVLHAGAVVRNGDAVVVVGPSGVGKTITTLGVAARGFELLSDDIVRLRPEGLVEGSPKPVGIRADAAALVGIDLSVIPTLPDRLTELSTRPVAASSLGVSFGSAGRPRLVVYPDPARALDSVDELSPGAGLARCCEHVFSFGRHEAAGFEALGDALADARHVVWGRGGLDRLVGVLDEIMTSA